MAQWAVILGGSSGFGLATAKKLAGDGYHLFIVHRDRRSYAKTLVDVWAGIRSTGVECIAVNANALDENRLPALLQEMRQTIGTGQVRILLHSLAQGNVKPLVGNEEGRLAAEDFSQTIYAMGTSWQVWTQGLLDHKLFTDQARTWALTSEGSTIAAQNYAAVGAAKAVLETLCRYMAREYAPFGLRANLVNAGVTRTRALEGIPDHEAYIESAIARNPFGRLTTPEDVANVFSLLARPEADWINGSIIRVDGGEQISGR